ncbi:spinster family MFS transporter [Geopseudomonas guangdongensis]|uniref:Predicted arabinose efflux permease, MFS family n=1 Tax=Geopseudomonas guangdongensis TaxID=1245526 RepID=A0A1H2I2S2_9GAMM|nr:MFS transporter [Pseudomonas guangdongensis]SDU38255.1 Predicted arabinose efflux permease, MFS family [Pseudomonas guangdongensis]
MARATPSPGLWHSHGLLFLMALMYADNFVGRQILAVMIEPIKQEFGASDSAMGLISGLAFAAVYAVLGLPAGRLADRLPRTRLLAASCLLWALATMACGLAGGFLVLILARMAVATAEAPATPTAFSLIADLYPPHRRSFAISCFTAAPTFAALIGLAGGAWLVETHGWRTTFILIGLPGLLIAALLAVTVREPQRGRWEISHVPAAPQGMLRTALELWREPALRCLLVAGGFCTLSGYALAMWNASFLVRSHDLSLQQAGLLAGLVGGGVAAIGTLTSGWLTDRLAQRSRLWLIGIPLLGNLIGGLAIAAYLLWPAGTLLHWGALAVPTALLWCALACFFSVWWVAPSYTLITHLAAPDRRGTVMAMQTILSTILGVGLGPLATGMLSDLLLPAFGQESLRHALLATSATVVLPMLLLWRVYRLTVRQQALALNATAAS